MSRRREMTAPSRTRQTPANCGLLKGLAVCAVVAASLSCSEQGFVATVENEGPRVFSEKRGAGYFERALIVPPDTFSAESLERLSTDFLTNRTADFKLYRLILGVSPQVVAEHTGGGKGFLHVACEGGVRMYNERVATKRVGPIAEITSLGGSAVLRWRGVDGRIGKKVLHGEDPMRMQVGGSEVELLHVVGVEAKPRFRDPPEELYRIHYFARTRDQPSLELARAAAHELSTRVGLRMISVELAEDHWFLDYSLFPIVYRYETVGEPPSCEEYSGGLRARCSFWDGELRCRWR